MSDRGEILVVQPGEGESYWQPVPANGHITIKVAPRNVRMENKFGLGTQTVAPGSYIREHAHDRNEELIYCLSGRGRAVIDGVDHPMQQGTTIFLGRNRMHMFVNESAEDSGWMALIEVADPSEVKNLMTREQYDEHLRGLE